MATEKQIADILEHADKTNDDVPVVAGMTVFHPEVPGALEVCWNEDQGLHALLLMNSKKCETCGHQTRSWRHVYMHECYSTREAAKAAE